MFLLLPRAASSARRDHTSRDASIARHSVRPVHFTLANISLHTLRPFHVTTRVVFSTAAGRVFTGGATDRSRVRCSTCWPTGVERKFVQEGINWKLIKLTKYKDFFSFNQICYFLVGKTYVLLEYRREEWITALLTSCLLLHWVLELGELSSTTNRCVI